MAETRIARWLLSRGNILMPVYDIEIETGKGPRVFSRAFQAAAPDLYVWNHNGAFWCEAKHKTVFTWYRKTKQWETGIDLHHWHHYERISSETKVPVWLLFLHELSTPDIKDRKHECCPDSCPTGLFGEQMDVLHTKVSHTSGRYGRYGMVYWAHRDLRMLDTLENVSKLSGGE